MGSSKSADDISRFSVALRWYSGTSSKISQAALVSVCTRCRRAARVERWYQGFASEPGGGSTPILAQQQSVPEPVAFFESFRHSIARNMSVHAGISADMIDEFDKADVRARTADNRRAPALTAGNRLTVSRSCFTSCTAVHRPRQAKWFAVARPDAG